MYKFVLVDVWFPVEMKGGLFLSFSYAVAPAVFLAFKFEDAVLAFWVARVVSSEASSQILSFTQRLFTPVSSLRSYPLRGQSFSIAYTSQCFQFGWPHRKNTLYKFSNLSTAFTFHGSPQYGQGAVLEGFHVRIAPQRGQT